MNGNLFAKFFTGLTHSKVGRAVCIISIITTMAISAATFTGCGTTEDTSSEVGNEQGDNRTDETNNPEQTGVEDSSVNQIEKGFDYHLSLIDLSKYSSAMQKIFSDDYYVQIIKNNRDANRTKAIPYGALNSLGYSNEDIYRILNDEYFAESFVYIKDNDLYVALNAEHKPSTEVYCGSFLLKYELTDQELYELKKLHRSNFADAGVRDIGGYIEAPLYIQALSQLKTPEVISRAYTTKEALKGSLSSCNDVNDVNYPVFMIYTGKKQYNDVSLTEAGIYSMTLFITNKANAVADATYIDLSSTKDNLSKFNDGIDILNNSISWKAKLNKMNTENTLESSLVPITRLNSNKSLQWSILSSRDDDWNYFQSINYANELNK